MILIKYFYSYKMNFVSSHRISVFYLRCYNSHKNFQKFPKSNYIFKMLYLHDLFSNHISIIIIEIEIDLCLMFLVDKFRCTKAGIKMLTFYDVETDIAIFIHITEAKVHD